MKKPISTIIKDQANQLERERASNESHLFDRKIQTATEGLIPYFSRTLYYKLGMISHLHRNGSQKLDQYQNMFYKTYSVG